MTPASQPHEAQQPREAQPTQRSRNPAAAHQSRSALDAAGLLLTGEMYGLQLDQLAAALGVTDRRAATLAASWSAAGLAESARLGPGPRWVWLTKAGLAACGLPYTATAPALSRLAHLRAVTAVRLALAAAPRFEAEGAYWRSERRLRSKFGRRLGLREHIPDGEVHWPDSGSVAWAGECWAIEAELTPKTVSRTTAIMRELLARVSDYGDEIIQASQPPRHTRAIYLCSPAAQPVVTRAANAIGPLAERVEIRLLPHTAAWPDQAGPDRRGRTAVHAEPAVLPEKS